MKIDTIIESYRNYQKVGRYPDTNEIVFCRTVKVRRADGVIALETEYLTEEYVQEELKGE